MAAVNAQKQEAFSGLLSESSLRRLTASLILAEQADLVSRRQMPPEALIPLRDPRLTDADRDGLTIDEGGLGFDSLARLGLVMRVNRFFGLSTTGVEDYLLVQRRLGDWVGLIGEHQRRIGADLALTFDTSGSSGPVKHLTHGLPGLMAEVEAHIDGPLAPFAAGGRVLAMVPPHHIYGCIFTCLLPDRLNREVVALQHLAPGALFRHARAGDLVVGTPFTWDLIGKAGLTLPAGVLGLTSAGPATPATFAVRAAAGLAHLTEVYGATETGGVATRDAFGAPFRLLSHVRREGTGIAGPGGPLPLQDRLDWVSDDLFHLMGRKDDVVQVAGVNVSPAHLREVLLGVAGVAEAAVRMGEGRLRAFLVPIPGHDLAELRTRLACRLTELPAPARPTSVTWGPALPRNPMGKLCDWEDANPEIPVTPT